MDQALELAGFFAAHGIWCVSDGEALVPMLAQIDQAGERSMSRFAADRLEDGVIEGKKQLIANSSRSVCAVLIYDGCVTLASNKTDALLMEIMSYSSPSERLSMAVPYRNRNAPQGFAVYRPKFLAYDGSNHPYYARFGEVFFRGVDSHMQGAAIWSKVMDQSI